MDDQERRAPSHEALDRITDRDHAVVVEVRGGPRIELLRVGQLEMLGGN